MHLKDLPQAGLKQRNDVRVNSVPPRSIRAPAPRWETVLPTHTGHVYIRDPLQYLPDPSQPLLATEARHTHPGDRSPNIAQAQGKAFTGHTGKSYLALAGSTTWTETVNSTA